MAASFRLILTRFGLPDKPEAPIRIVDGRPTWPTPCPEPRHVEFAIIKTHVSLVLVERMTIERLMRSK